MYSNCMERLCDFCYTVSVQEVNMIYTDRELYNQTKCKLSIQLNIKNIEMFFLCFWGTPGAISPSTFFFPDVRSSSVSLLYCTVRNCCPSTARSFVLVLKNRLFPWMHGFQVSLSLPGRRHQLLFIWIVIYLINWQVNIQKVLGACPESCNS